MDIVGRKVGGLVGLLLFWHNIPLYEHGFVTKDDWLLLEAALGR
jgi:hypothetical protein